MLKYRLSVLNVCSHLFVIIMINSIRQILSVIIDLFIGEHPRTTAVHTMARVQVTSGLTVTHVQMEPLVSTTALAGPGEGITALTRKTLVSPVLPMRIPNGGLYPRTITHGTLQAMLLYYYLITFTHFITWQLELGRNTNLLVLEAAIPYRDLIKTTVHE